MKGEVEKRVGARTETWSPFSISGRQAATECGDEVGGFMWKAERMRCLSSCFCMKLKGQTLLEEDLLREC